MKSTASSIKSTNKLDGQFGNDIYTAMVPFQE